MSGLLRKGNFCLGSANKIRHKKTMNLFDFCDLIIEETKILNAAKIKQFNSKYAMNRFIITQKENKF